MGATHFPRGVSRETGGELFETAHGPALSAAIEDLYSAFGGRILDTSFEVCSHCYAQGTETFFRKTPPRALSDFDAAYLLSSVGNTIGHHQHVNYFIPRLLDALACGVHYMEHVIPSLLTRGRAQGWSELELQSICTFFTVFFAAMGALPENAKWYFAFEGLILELWDVLPEVADSMELELRGL